MVVDHVDPKHRYINVAERDNQPIYDDFKLKKTLGLYKNISNFLNISSRHAREEYISTNNLIFNST